MIKINFLHFCDLAFTAEDNKTLSVIRIFDYITTRGFPAAHPRFTIVFNILSDSDQTPWHKDYELKIISPNKKDTIVSVGGSFSLGKQTKSANIICDFFGTIFPMEGKYSIQILVDKKLVSSEDYALEIKTIL